MVVEKLSLSSLHTSHLNICVDSTSHSCLASHVIQGVPVLPACVVMSWFVQAAKTHRPALTVVECRNFRVLRGVRLMNFYEKPQHFTVICTEKQHGSNHLFLQLNASEMTTAPYYVAEILLSDSPSVEPIISAHLNQPTNPVSWPYTMKEIYGEALGPQTLFHGPEFQVISKLDWVSDYGGVAQLVSEIMEQWSGDWLLDSAAIDGVLQLLWLWGVRMVNKPSLPTAIRSIRFYGEHFDSYRFQCTFTSSLLGLNRTSSDVVLTKDNGGVYAELKGVEMVCFDHA